MKPFKDTYSKKNKKRAWNIPDPFLALFKFKAI